MMASIDTLASDFNSGVLASFVGTCTYENFLTPDGFELGVAKTPTGDTEWAPSFNRGMIVFKSNEKEEAAICDFVSYFTNKENSARWCMSIQALSPAQIRAMDIPGRVLSFKRRAQTLLETCTAAAVDFHRVRQRSDTPDPEKAFLIL